jgi:hypothetical protein
MSAWRRVALEKLPELKRTIEEASNPMALWIEIRLRFEDAFDRGDKSFVGRALEYGKWSWRVIDGEAPTAVACAFFEHLPEHEGMRQEIPRWFTRGEFEELKGVFTYHAGKEVVAQLERAFSRART